MSQFPRAGMDASNTPRKKGLGVGAIIAIVVGVLLVVPMCGGLLIGIMLPATGRARDAARGFKAKTQVTVLVQACHMYASDNKGYLPPAATWDLALSNYASTSGQASMTDSPQIDGTGNEMIYTLPTSARLGVALRVDEIPFPAEWILIREDESRLAPHQKIAVGFADGSANLLTRDELAAALARHAGK